MPNQKTSKGVVTGYVAIAILALGIMGASLSVWAKPYTSAQNPVKTVAMVVLDTTKTMVISDNAKEAMQEINAIDTVAINTAFLCKMREKGELLSSDEFASRITDYYNTLVAVLTALFVLFTLVTYITFKSKFEGKFEDKARELEDKQRQLEDKQRQKIVEELRSMLSDSKSIEVVIQNAIGGRIDDNIAKKEEVDDLTESIEITTKNVSSLMINVGDLKKRQQELFNVVADLQDQVASSAMIRHNEDAATDGKTEQLQDEEKPKATE